MKPEVVISIIVSLYEVRCLSLGLYSDQSLYSVSTRKFVSSRSKLNQINLSQFQRFRPSTVQRRHCQCSVPGVVAGRLSMESESHQAAASAHTNLVMHRLAWHNTFCAGSAPLQGECYAVSWLTASY